MERIRLTNTVFEGQNNVYLLDGPSTALVDTGVAQPAVRAELESALAEAGLGFEDVDDVVLTHWHADHAGLAGAIQEAGGATVWVHEADAPLVAGDEAALEAEAALRDRRFAEWGIPSGKRDELRRYLDDHRELWTGPPTVETVTDGDVVDAGGYPLEAVHLPGHAAGLTAFRFDHAGRREAFVGDAILPKYTPNVGGADLRVDDALARYVESLLRVVDLDLDRAWPGHRDPIDDPTARALTILDHHRERTRRVVDVLREHGPADAWTVSAHLFGELEAIHILHGPGEAHAHLEHLQSADVVARDGDAYRLIEDRPDVESLFPSAPNVVGG